MYRNIGHIYKFNAYILALKLSSNNKSLMFPFPRCRDFAEKLK